MKTAIKPDIKSKTLYSKKIYTLSREKETGLVNCKFYQKLFAIPILISTFGLLIPKHLS